MKLFLQILRIILSAIVGVGLAYALYVQFVGYGVAERALVKYGIPFTPLHLLLLFLFITLVGMFFDWIRKRYFS